MTHATGAASERVLILAPQGRDAQSAASILEEAKIDWQVCDDLACLVEELGRGAGCAVVVEEVLQQCHDLAHWVGAQPAWSDFPFVVLALRGAGLERNPVVRRFTQTLGNISLIERPFHPTTLVSVAQTALRGRSRQYEARERIEAIRAAEELLERRVAERTAELQSANRQLANQIAEREVMESALRRAQRLEAVGQLTSGVAHDFNNLLMVVLGNIRQMQRTADDPVTVRRLKMMAHAAERGAQLTTQMLAFSRSQKLDPQIVNLNKIVRRMYDLLQSTMGGGVQPRTVLQDDLWPATIDPTQIELVILNLAINAKDAMSVGGSLTVETANVTLGAPSRDDSPAAGDYVMVSVSDTGSGIPPEVLDKVFEPFFTTKAVGKGSGLGLSQVYGLAKQSGGGVAIETTSGAGTTVKVYLPRSVDPATLAPVDSPFTSIKAPDHLVLLVDDDSAVREVTAAMLQDVGYKVVEAGSRGGALDALDHNDQIELLLVDFAMPGINGAEVAREVHARRPRLPIVFITGHGDAEILSDPCGHELLRKPFRLDELAAKLDAALAHRA